MHKHKRDHHTRRQKAYLSQMQVILPSFWHLGSSQLRKCHLECQYRFHPPWLPLIEHKLRPHSNTSNLCGWIPAESAVTKDSEMFIGPSLLFDKTFFPKKFSSNWTFRSNKSHPKCHREIWAITILTSFLDRCYVMRPIKCRKDCGPASV